MLIRLFCRPKHLAARVLACLLDGCWAGSPAAKHQNQAMHRAARVDTKFPVGLAKAGPAERNHAQSGGGHQPAAQALDALRHGQAPTAYPRAHLQAGSELGWARGHGWLKQADRQE